MAIEKMTFIDIKGSADYLDQVLVRCASCGVFQPENAARMSEYSIGSATLLRNIYGGLLVKILETANQFGVPVEYRESPGCTDPQPDPEAFVEQTHSYLDGLRDQYPAYFEKQKSLSDEINAYSAALEMLRHIHAPDIDFDRLWENKFLKVRFGRMPESGVEKLDTAPDIPYELYQLEKSMGQVWCLYITTGEYGDKADHLFQSLGFERLRIPDFVHGTAQDAMTFLQEGLVEERERLSRAVEDLLAFVAREKETFLTVYTRVKFLHDAYDLRRYAVVIRGQFHVVGYVQARNRDAFVARFDGVPSVVIAHEPANSDGPIPVPVRLRNNWFVRPFEMFVNMYGSPSYDDIDPTPFVAYTYSALFGMMFGDLGHGLCVFLLGLFLGQKKKMELGRIMSRVGVASMFCGFWYGSVFGFEHLLDPFFKGVLGLPSKPIEIMQPSTTNLILVAAIAIGAAVILMVILFNICIGIKHRDFDRAVLSSNGLAGFIFYAAALFAAVSAVLGNSVLNAPYALCLLVLPLLVIFFREPIARYLQYRSKESIIHSDHDLEDTAQFKEGSVDIPELFTTQFVAARFGRLPIDSYRKLHFYQNEPFMIYPLKTDREYIWCIYATSTVNKAEIDAIFHDLYFERIYIPDEDMVNTERAEAFIKKCVDAGGQGATVDNGKYGQVTISCPKTIYQTLFPSGFGGFFTETFFELFEVLLSFITNTMSFLRVGGFILVHAGMMEVVFKLSEMVGGGAGPVIIVIGNIFVMAMEGLIVGIQVLRLEFYEIFSRFFGAAGEMFQPFSVSYADDNVKS